MAASYIDGTMYRRIDPLHSSQQDRVKREEEFFVLRAHAFSIYIPLVRTMSHKEGWNMYLVFELSQNIHKIDYVTNYWGHFSCTPPKVTDR